MGERERFEEWWSDYRDGADGRIRDHDYCDFSTTKDGSRYVESQMRNMERAWQARARIAEQERAELLGCLRWYAKHLKDCNRRGSMGDEARDHLARDGGQKARAILDKHSARDGREGK